jgi:glycosyltransferase involved in cell wall biosynthesis
MSALINCQYGEKISIIIPLFNAENYISDCIKSIFSQTSDKYELIIIDDGSTDSSISKCADLIRDKKNAHLLQQKNSGPNMARNLGLTYARGEYVVFIDADDIIESNTVEKMLDAIEKYNPDFINYGFDFFENGTNKIRKKSHFSVTSLDGDQIFRDSLLGRNVAAVCWNKCYKKSIIDENHLEFIPDKKHGRDTMFTWEFAYASRSTIFINDILYHSRCGQKSFSRNFSKTNIESAIDLALKQYSVFSLNVPVEEQALLDFAVGRQLRYILLLSAFRSISFTGFSSGVALLKDNNLWAITTGITKNLVHLGRPKDIVIALLLRHPYICWILARMLLKVNYYPY